MPFVYCCSSSSKKVWEFSRINTQHPHTCCFPLTKHIDLALVVCFSIVNRTMSTKGAKIKEIKTCKIIVTLVTTCYGLPLSKYLLFSCFYLWYKRALLWLNVWTPLLVSESQHVLYNFLCSPCVLCSFVPACLAVYSDLFLLVLVKGHIKPYRLKCRSGLWSLAWIPVVK